MASILVARELPPWGNGAQPNLFARPDGAGNAERADTLWASMHAVYESLSDGLKRTLEGMTGVHLAGKAFSPDSAKRQVWRALPARRRQGAVRAAQERYMGADPMQYQKSEYLKKARPRLRRQPQLLLCLAHAASRRSSTL